MNNFDDVLTIEEYIRASKSNAKINALKTDNVVSIEAGGDFLTQIFLLAQIIEGLSKKLSKEVIKDGSSIKDNEYKNIVDAGKEIGLTDEMIDMCVMTECVMSLIHEMHDMNVVRMSMGGIKAHMVNSKEELDVMKKFLNMNKKDVEDIINNINKEK